MKVERIDHVLVLNVAQHEECVLVLVAAERVLKVLLQLDNAQLDVVLGHNGRFRSVIAAGAHHDLEPQHLAENTFGGVAVGHVQPEHLVVGGSDHAVVHACVYGQPTLSEAHLAADDQVVLAGKGFDMLDHFPELVGR